jgi:hypothetical protein
LGLREVLQIAPYSELLNKEAEIIGVSDHLASEIPVLLVGAHAKLDLSHGIIRTVPLEAGAVNGVLDRLEEFGDDLRVVISPWNTLRNQVAKRANSSTLLRLEQTTRQKSPGNAIETGAGAPQRPAGFFKACIPYVP